MADPRSGGGEPGNFGIAIDIGTTTVAAYLVDLSGKGGDGPRVVAAASKLNGQRIFGADEFDRIQYTLRIDRGVDELSRLARADVRSLVDGLLSRVGAKEWNLNGMSVVGSTAMLRLFAERHPYRGANEPLACERVEATALGLPYPRCAVTIAPTARDGIGADLLAAIDATGLEARDELTLLIDLGSKGAVALGDRRGISCCVSEGGPPFEGPSFSCGTGGVRGAVESLAWESGRLRWTTTEGGDPIGLSASGVVDAAACLVRASVVESSGAMDEILWPGGYTLVRSPETVLSFTQADVRRIQLAKAGVATGISALLDKRGVGHDAVARVLISGSFGGKISPVSAAVIGLLPASLADRAEGIGNASGSGAVGLLLKERQGERLEAIAERCLVVDPSTTPGFDERISGELRFPAPDAVLEEVVPEPNAV